MAIWSKRWFLLLNKSTYLSHFRAITCRTYQMSSNGQKHHKFSGNLSQLYRSTSIIYINIVVETEDQLGSPSSGPPPPPRAVPRGTGWKTSIERGSHRRWVCELVCVYVKNLRALELWLCWWRRGDGAFSPTYMYTAPPPTAQPPTKSWMDTEILPWCNIALKTVPFLSK